MIQATLRTNFFQTGPDGEPKTYVSFKLDPHADPGPAGPAAQVRDLGVLARGRGRAPALRQGRARRPALVRPPRGLPHRGPGPGQGADGEERGDRAGRCQGRVLRQEPAGPGGGPRRLAGRGHRQLQDLHLRPAGHHRQPGRRRGRAAGRRGAPRRRRPLPGGGRRQGHRDVLRHRQRRGRSTTGSGSATPSPPAARSATTTRPWASPRAAPGSRSSATSASSAWTPRTRTSPSSASATCPATCSATACCCPSTSGWSRPSTTGTSSSTPSPDAAKSFAERQRMFDLPRSLLGGLRHELISRRRRRLPAQREVDPDLPAGAPGARDPEAVGPAADARPT